MPVYVIHTHTHAHTHTHTHTHPHRYSYIPTCTERARVGVYNTVIALVGSHTHIHSLLSALGAPVRASVHHRSLEDRKIERFRMRPSSCKLCACVSVRVHACRCWVGQDSRCVPCHWSRSAHTRMTTQHTDTRSFADKRTRTQVTSTTV